MLAIPASVGLVIGVAACSSSPSGGESGEGGESSDASADCSAFPDYGDLSGKTVSVYATFIDTEAAEYE